MFLSDHETPVDLLYYDAIAKTIVKLIKGSKRYPISVGLHGDWGAGKSSVLAMAETELKKEPSFVCLRFNGWQLQGFEDAKAALIEAIITQLRDERKDKESVVEKATDLLGRFDYIKLGKKSIPWIVTAMTGIPHLAAIKDAVGLLQGLANTAEGDLTPDKIKEAIVGVEGFIKPAEKEKMPEKLREFEKKFEELLEAAKVEKLVVLIDDLDRCLPATAIETLEAIRLFLFTRKTAFIIAADEAMIEYAVKQHFPDLPDTSGPASYARNYLEKLIQVPFRVPSLGLTETQIYIALILIQSELGEDNADFLKILSKARECLSKPWKGMTLDRETAGACLTKGAANHDKVSHSVADAITLSQQISGILTEGTRGNPRQIKRFLNSILLRGEIAEARGLGAEITKAALAKIMLVEAFRPGFYTQLNRWAGAAISGKAPELKAIENLFREVSTQSAPTGEAAGTRPGIEGLDEWVKDEWIQSWAKTEPSLQDVDLRPYMFVTRDKRSYFGGTTGKSHLDSIVASLLGGQMAVGQAQTQFAKLNPSDAQQVFEMVSSQLMQAENFAERPLGLIALAKTFEPLQDRLLGFLEHIPAAKRKPWLMSGFDAVFMKQSVKNSYEALKKTWARDNTQLAAAAKHMSPPKKKRD